MHVGILYPRSKAHPGITQDFIDGIKTFLAQEPDNDITIIPEAIGFGGSEKEVYEKAEKLLMLEGVDVLAAYIGEKVIDLLLPLMQASGKLLLVVHPGANYPASRIPHSNIIHLTLQHAFLCWLSGKDAKKQKPGSAALVTTFYDCGYLHTATMVNGYSDTGNDIVFNYINRDLYDDSFQIKELENYLTVTPTLHNLLCVCDDLPATLLYDRLNKISTAPALNLTVSPMMLEPRALAGLDGKFKFRINGYSPWQAGIKSDPQNLFKDGYAGKTKRTPGIFALLGWETGMILKQIADTNNQQFEDGAAIATQLQQSTLTGPRGLLKLDADTHYFTAPFVQCCIENDADKMTAIPTDFPWEAWREYIQLPLDNISSGWTNTYLCY